METEQVSNTENGDSNLDELKALVEDTAPATQGKRNEKPQQKRKKALAAAAQLVAQEKQQRAEACMAAVSKVLGEFRCEIVGVPEITEDGRITVQMGYRALD